MDSERRQGLDLLQAAHVRRLCPLIFCRLRLDGHLDLVRLVEAVHRSCRYVPQVLWAYDFRRGLFQDRGLTAGRAVHLCRGAVGGGGPWDLGAGPQIQIHVRREGGQDAVTVGVSHILCDGAGFLQYLYLLSSLYNGETPPDGLCNRRSLPRRLGGCPSRAIPVPGPSLPLEPGDVSACLTAPLGPAEFQALRAKAGAEGVTLNDAFLAAYAQVAAGLLGAERLVLPCPADLRRLLPGPAGLTVANLTGMYRVAVEPAPSFPTTLERVHGEMCRQKARRSCCAGLPLLRRAARVLPPGPLRGLIRRFYRLSPVSYSNLGEIDAARLRFDGCAVRACFLSGACRTAPDFQLTVSTFQGTCTLSSALTASRSGLTQGRNVLESVRRELTQWAPVS